MAMYAMTFEFAQVDQPPPPETQQLLGAVAGNKQAIDDFVSVQAGTLPIPEFFSPDNIARVMGHTTELTEVAALQPMVDHETGLCNDQNDAETDRVDERRP